MDFNFFKSKKAWYLLILIPVLLYVILKAYSAGNDINVYLFASQQLFSGENIYAANPFNNYLYSPLFALLLGPLSLLDFSIARVVWAIINSIVAYRLWKIAYVLLEETLGVDKKLSKWWTLGLIIISFGFLNHNLILGQITIIILWLSLEGLFQIICKDNATKGALLLALGINIKIIPLIGLYYLFFKGKYKALALSIAFVGISLLLPSLFTGHKYNVEMLSNWAETINPSSNRYIFENNNGTHSLNATLPAFFYDFNDGKESPIKIRRQIAKVPHNTLVIILQSLRITFLLSCLIVIFYRHRRREEKDVYFYWEFSYLALVTALIFPHQQKYAMLYFVPAGSYIFMFILLAYRRKWDIGLKDKVIIMLALPLMFVSAIMGRDIIGDYLVDILDYFHTFGLINIIFLLFLILVRPDQLLRMRAALQR